MSLNITSKQTTIKLGPHKGKEMYVMNVFVKPRAKAKLALIMPRRENDCCVETKVYHYSTVGAEKIIWYASETSNIPKAVLRASWEALGQAITSWVLEGHIVEIPGLGNIRAEVRAKAQSKAEDVTESDILRRKLLLTPTKEIKNALNSTPININCFDSEGNEMKRESNLIK